MEDALEVRAGDWVVFYGSLMRGLGGLERVDAGAALRFVGPCRVRGELYDLGDWPGLRHGDARVLGELFAVLDATVAARLDAFEDFDPADLQASYYLRERVELVEPANTPAWVYVYNRVPGADARIASGDWRAHLAARGAAGNDRA